MEGTDVGRAVSEEDDRDVARSAVSVREPGSNRDRDATAHDPICPEHV